MPRRFTFSANDRYFLVRYLHNTYVCEHVVGILLRAAAAEDARARASAAINFSVQ